MKRFGYYALWTLALGIILYQGSEFQLYLKEQAQMTYEIRPQLIFGVTYPILIGLLLKLPSMLAEWKTTNWGIDWSKLIAVGLPCLYLSLGLLLMMLPLAKYMPLLYYVMTSGHPTIHTVAGIVFGYVLLDSIRISQPLEGH